MKILSSNAGYFLGYTGHIPDYILNPVKGVIGSKKDELENIEKFTKIAEDMMPDIILLQEVDTGSVRTRTGSQPEYLVENIGDGFKHNSGIKYSVGLLKKLPVFRKMANSVLYRDGEITNHYLGNGSKSLVQEIKIKDLSIFSVHLSLTSSNVRLKQLKELYSIAKTRKKFVITGDFNFHKGKEEIDKLKELVDGSIIVPGKTFPAHSPERELDFAICSSNLEVSCKTINSTFSDHRPIMIEIENFQP